MLLIVNNVPTRDLLTVETKVLLCGGWQNLNINCQQTVNIAICIVRDLTSYGYLLPMMSFAPAGAKHRSQVIVLPIQKAS